MVEPKDGSAGKPVPPAAPKTPEAADLADFGEMKEIKAEQIAKGEGKYGSNPVKKHKPKTAAEKTDEDQAAQEEDPAPESWIEIKLVGEDDEPIPGERYSITLPDGETVAEGTLDEKGEARVEGIEKGDCRVTFPDLDQDAWEKKQ